MIESNLSLDIRVITFKWATDHNLVDTNRGFVGDYVDWNNQTSETAQAINLYAYLVSGSFN